MNEKKQILNSLEEEKFMRQKRRPTLLGMRIKQKCFETNLFENELAERYGMKKQYLSMIIYGDRGTGKYTKSLAEFLEISEEEVQNLHEQYLKPV